MMFPWCKFLLAYRVANPAIRVKAFSIIDENQVCQNYTRRCRATALSREHNFMYCFHEFRPRTKAGIYRESRHNLSSANVCGAQYNLTRRLVPYPRAYDDVRK